ncbi:hypothetical protein [Hoeflea sp.]|uniref:hypothetical protein n=1 Tax=Hoeflea sp. TaxID=1940281 RepID=UPI003B523660
MGVSERTAKAFEPKAVDLLMPERRLQRRQTRMRDIEDASFEIVGGGAASHPDTRFRLRPHGVFKSRLDARLEEGPVPRDFAADEPMAASRSAAGGRLGVFAGTFPSPAARHQGTARMGFAVMVGTVALAVFWMAGGHAFLLAPDTQVEASATSVPLQASRSSAPIVAEPDPVITSSVPVERSVSDGGSIIHPKPRPARIERAGSILMIRPEAD